MRTVFLLILLTGTAFAAKEVQRTFPLSPDGRLTVHTEKGSVRISTWDNPRIEIYARIDPDSGVFGGNSEMLVADTEIQIDASATSVRIKTDYSRARRNTSWFGLRFNTDNLPLVHYRIRLPRTAAATIKDYKSRVEVSGLRSDLEVDSYKGEIRVDDLEGSIKLNTYKGEADVRLSRLDRRSSFETYKGEIRIGISGTTGFRLNSDLGRRAGLRSDFDGLVRSASGRDQRFLSEINGGGPEIRLKSYKGEFRIRKL